MNSTNKFLLLTAICVSSLIAPPTRAQTEFVARGDMLATRSGEAITRLDDGRVFVVGTLGVNAAELYNPSSGQFSWAASLATARFAPAVAKLNDGRVLVAGGGSTVGTTALNSTEIYDPTTNTFSNGFSLPEGCFAGKSVTLLDGRVLLAGNWGANWSVRGTAIVLNPTTGAASLISLRVGRAGGALVRLNDGRVLLAGGLTYSGTSSMTASMEVFDPSTNTFTSIASMSQPRDPAGILLPNGKVLLVGGPTPPSGAGTNVCELFDPATNRIIATYHMNTARQYPAVSLTDDGKVMISSPDTPKVEIFDPAYGTFALPTSMPSVTRNPHFLCSLQDGSVLLLGGGARRSEQFVRTNLLPTANAGSDRVVYAGTSAEAVITLDGTGSTDPENAQLSYSWVGAFGSATGASPTVTLPLGVNVITLTVTDNVGQHSSATAFISVVQGIDAAAYSQLTSQIQTLVSEKTVLEGKVNQLEQSITSLKAALGSVSAGFDDIKTHALAIIGICDQKVQEANAAKTAN
ncbi:kelch repeat-containing protein [Opitutus sp. ER46]|uniref:kelch repeat-containing protein n=1 Tax=Opitutus sp. ER46 TaxID=2161864 RepID=UPI001304E49A|nr:kelch repeat-containing protein [Opitutus sp. ER46]